MIDQVMINQYVLSGRQLTVSEGSIIIGWQGNLNLYYFEIRMKSFLFGFLQNQREIAENYPNFLKTQKALLPVEMSNFNQKNKIKLSQIRH